MVISDVLRQLQGRLVVSCQAPDGDAFRDAECMARFARAAREGGAAGIRTNGAEDVRAIRQAVHLPIVAIGKRVWSDGRILITGDFEDARQLAAAGAEMIALDVTARGQRFGALERLTRIRRELGVVTLADIATLEEAVAAERAGADAVLSTMRGYTDDTAHTRGFEPDFIAALRRAVRVPVIAEGRIGTPAEAAAAIRNGAWAVIVGTAITRPSALTRAFAEAVERACPYAGDVLGIDMGATHTKYGVVTADGHLAGEGVVPTPRGGGEVLLGHLVSIARAHADGVRAVGVATAGWVDPEAGRVIYATRNLPGWTGAPIAARLREATGLPVAVENDGHALAAAESCYGAARGVRDFVCITLGTGVGGGVYAGGRLLRGAHGMANALGHITIVPGGMRCTCGQDGCLEMYANAAALVRFAGGAHADAKEVIAAASTGEARAVEAVRQLARNLARGVTVIERMLDPGLVVVAGGLIQDNPLLLDALREETGRGFAGSVPRIEASSLGYFAGVFGAAAVAHERG